MRLTTAIRRFDAQLRADGKSPHTQAVYLRDLHAFNRWLGRSIDISQITPQLLTQYLTSKSFTRKETGKPRATITMNRMKSALRSFFQFLTEAGYLEDNPARLIRHARSTRKPPVILADREVRKLLGTLRGAKTPIARRDHLMFALLLSTGIRLGSLIALNIEDVDLSQGTLRIKGKNGEEQFVFLSYRIRTLLKAHLASHDFQPTDPLFLSNRGRRIGARQVELRLAYWLKKAGITHRCSVHSLRHAFATRLYEKTGDLRLAQQALGHKHITTTEIYAHVADSRLKRAVQSLNLLD